MKKEFRKKLLLAGILSSIGVAEFCYPEYAQARQAIADNACKEKAVVAEIPVGEKQTSPIYYSETVNEYFTKNGENVFRITSQQPSQTLSYEEIKMFFAPVGYVLEGSHAYKTTVIPNKKEYDTSAILERIEMEDGTEARMLKEKALIKKIKNSTRALPAGVEVKNGMTVKTEKVPASEVIFYVVEENGTKVKYTSEEIEANGWVLDKENKTICIPAKTYTTYSHTASVDAIREQEVIDVEVVPTLSIKGFELLPGMTEVTEIPQEVKTSDQILKKVK